jgi:cation diffusion facilitator CzcD-associated flavoprotein CzcO
MTTVDDSTTTAPAPPAFDPDALRERYRAERDKRLRADGNEQYVAVDGEFAHYLDDPYTEPFEREPRFDEVEVVVIGGGFGGLLAGARLRDAGIDDLLLIEKGGDVGGTWYWNRYPGAACDTESYVYMPLLEETGYLPTEKYAKAPEILEHHRRIARQWGLYERALLGTEVTEARWDEDEDRWIVTTNRGERLRTRFLVQANGPLHRPKLPGIPGVDSYAGHSFHTSRWDYDYTGGDSTGGMVGLEGKRVGIIGTGATAVQCIPHLAETAGHLYVFQRTPSSIDVRNNRPTDPEWAASLEPGWQQRRMENFVTLTSGGWAAEDLVNDGWTDIIGKLMTAVTSNANADLSPEGLLKLVELADFEKMESIRARVDQIVEDRATADALKPWYRQFCKRPCFHDQYLQTFNQSNVTLVDTDGRGVERITEKGVVVAGVEYELDCLVFATGFEVGTGYSRRAGYETFGVDGVTLTDAWADGVETLHGMHSPGFPNLFVFGLAQAAFSVTIPYVLDIQARHVAYLVSEAEARGTTRVEVERAAVDAWIATIMELSSMNQDFLESCTPGYYNNEGKLNDQARQNSFYGAGAIAFGQVLEQWRTEGSLAGLTLE